MLAAFLVREATADSVRQSATCETEVLSDSISNNRWEAHERVDNVWPDELLARNFAVAEDRAV